MALAPLPIIAGYIADLLPRPRARATDPDESPLEEEFILGDEDLTPDPTGSPSGAPPGDGPVPVSRGGDSTGSMDAADRPNVRTAGDEHIASVSIASMVNGPLKRPAEDAVDEEPEPKRVASLAPDFQLEALDPASDPLKIRKELNDARRCARQAEERALDAESRARVAYFEAAETKRRFADLERGKETAILRVETAEMKLNVVSRKLRKMDKEMKEIKEAHAKEVAEKVAAAEARAVAAETRAKDIEDQLTQLQEKLKGFEAGAERDSAEPTDRESGGRTVSKSLPVPPKTNRGSADEEESEEDEPPRRPGVAKRKTSSGRPSYREALESLSSEKDDEDADESSHSTNDSRKVGNRYAANLVAAAARGAWGYDLVGFQKAQIAVGIRAGNTKVLRDLGRKFNRERGVEGSKIVDEDEDEFVAFARRELPLLWPPAKSGARPGGIEGNLLPKSPKIVKSEEGRSELGRADSAPSPRREKWDPERLPFGSLVLAFEEKEGRWFRYRVLWYAEALLVDHDVTASDSEVEGTPGTMVALQPVGWPARYYNWLFLDDRGRRFIAPIGSKQVEPQDVFEEKPKEARWYDFNVPLFWQKVPHEWKFHKWDAEELQRAPGGVWVRTRWCFPLTGYEHLVRSQRMRPLAERVKWKAISRRTGSPRSKPTSEASSDDADASEDEIIDLTLD